MPTLLRLDASARLEGSYTRRMADHLVERWLAANPGCRVVTRDLARQAPPHLDAATLAGFRDPSRRTEALAISDELIDELLEADVLLVASPLYNFGPPSTLKAWVDLVARAGKTFDVGPDGYVGRLTGRRAFLVTACGANDAHMAVADAQVPWLQTVLAFLGFERIDVVRLAGTSESGEELEGRLGSALRRIEGIELASDREIARTEWDEGLSSTDRLAIDELRHAQVRCIEQGDAPAYAELCTDDVILMLQGHPVVRGRHEFLASEARLLAGTRFRALRQSPLRVELRGDSVIEVGRQEVELEPDGQAAAHFRPRRKYTHVLRRTDRGWRFAVLMSNSDE